MLRDVVVHILNEQPIVADLVSEPMPSDVALICRNLRTINGKKPVFVDRSDSTFILPLATVRFLEIHRESVEAHEAETAAQEAQELAVAAEAEYANGALARLDWGSGDDGEPIDAHQETRRSDGPSRQIDPDELDDDLLRRIREA
jgi:hypothetical protein